MKHLYVFGRTQSEVRQIAQARGITLVGSMVAERDGWKCRGKAISHPVPARSSWRSVLRRRR